MSELEINEDNCVLNQQELEHICAAFQNILNDAHESYKEKAESIYYSTYTKITKLNDMAKKQDR